MIAFCTDSLWPVTVRGRLMACFWSKINSCVCEKRHFRHASYVLTPVFGQRQLLQAMAIEHAQAC